MGYVVLNNAKSTLATALLIGDTSAAVQSGDGALFAVGSNYSFLVLEDGAGNREVVKITARASDALTISRGEDGTIERSWNIGDIIECRPCRAAIEALKTENATHAATEKVSVVDDDEIAVVDSEASWALKRAKLSSIATFIRLFTQQGTGAVARSLFSKLYESLSAGDFNIAGNRSTDDYAKLQAALNEAGQGGSVVVPRGMNCLTSRPLQTRGAVLILDGATLGAHPTFAADTMDDGRTSSALVYIAGNSGAYKGGGVRAESFDTSFYNLDASSPDGVKRADHCIEVQSCDNFEIARLMVRRGAVSNIRFSGLGFGARIQQVYSAHSPIAFGFDPVTPLGGQYATAHFDTCYAVGCGQGWYARGVFAATLTACAADQCDIGLYAANNGRIIANGFTAEGCVQVAREDGGYISWTGGLVANYGTAATTEANTYSGQSDPETSDVTGLYAFHLSTNSTFELKGVLFGSGTSGTTEKVLYTDSTYNKFYELENWANYSNTPKKGILEYALATAGASFAVTIGANTEVRYQYAYDENGYVVVGRSKKWTAAIHQVKSTSNSVATRDSWVDTSSGTRYHYQFRDGSGGTARGSITTDGANTSYATSSDYRLKTDVAPITGALASVLALNPVVYTWISNGNPGEGFIAHELASIVPQAVTGEKDAIDDDGNPAYQQVDTSFLVARLVAAIQELKAEFDVYVAEHS